MLCIKLVLLNMGMVENGHRRQDVAPSLEDCNTSETIEGDCIISELVRGLI